MQTQWPALGPTFDFSSVDAAGGFDTAVPLRRGGAPGAAEQSDAIARPWWTCGTAAAQTGGAFGLGALFGIPGGFGVLTNLINVLQQIVGALLNGSTAGSAQPQPGTPANSNRTGYEQSFRDVDVSSTGDPHIAEVGTREGPGGGTRAVDSRWDSMTGHDDLVHSNQIEGGYRVSTTVTPAGAGGATFNQSATVHTNFDQAAVMMNRDGSYSIFDDLQEVALGKGESATLSGGETVTANQDGSLTVSANNGRGSIATTLRSTGDGVDVIAHAHEIALGGDAVTHGAPKARAGHTAHAHHPHHHAHHTKRAVPMEQPLAR